MEEKFLKPSAEQDKYGSPFNIHDEEVLLVLQYGLSKHKIFLSREIYNLFDLVADLGGI